MRVMLAEMLNCDYDENESDDKCNGHSKIMITLMGENVNLRQFWLILLMF